MTILDKRKRCHSPLGIEEGSFHPRSTGHPGSVSACGPRYRACTSARKCKPGYEMCQLKRQPIQVIVLKISIARVEPRRSRTCQRMSSARGSRSRHPPILLASDTCRVQPERCSAESETCCMYYPARGRAAHGSQAAIAMRAVHLRN
jgi:hypothetical protein